MSHSLGWIRNVLASNPIFEFDCAPNKASQNTPREYVFIFLMTEDSLVPAFRNSSSSRVFIMKLEY